MIEWSYKVTFRVSEWLAITDGDESEVKERLKDAVHECLTEDLSKDRCIEVIVTSLPD